MSNTRSKSKTSYATHIFPATEQRDATDAVSTAQLVHWIDTAFCRFLQAHSQFQDCEPLTNWYPRKYVCPTRDGEMERGRVCWSKSARSHFSLSNIFSPSGCPFTASIKEGGSAWNPYHYPLLAVIDLTAGTTLTLILHPLKSLPTTGWVNFIDLHFTKFESHKFLYFLSSKRRRGKYFSAIRVCFAECTRLWYIEDWPLGMFCPGAAMIYWYLVAAASLATVNLHPGKQNGTLVLSYGRIQFDCG